MSRTSRQMLAIGPLSKNSASLQHYIANGHSFEHPDRICNAMQSNMTPEEARQLLAGSPARPGSQDFKRHPSRGQSC